MTTRTYSHSDFTIEVEKPDPPATAWGRIKEFFLHPLPVIVTVRLHDGIRPRMGREQLVVELRAEFGLEAVPSPEPDQPWFVQVWIPPKVYSDNTVLYIADLVSAVT